MPFTIEVPVGVLPHPDLILHIMYCMIAPYYVNRRLGPGRETTVVLVAVSLISYYASMCTYLPWHWPTRLCIDLPACNQVISIFVSCLDEL